MKLKVIHPNIYQQNLLLYDLQNELLKICPASRFGVVIAGVTDRHRMRLFALA